MNRTRDKRRAYEKLACLIIGWRDELTVGWEKEIEIDIHDKTIWLSCRKDVNGIIGDDWRKSPLHVS